MATSRKQPAKKAFHQKNVRDYQNVMELAADAASQFIRVGVRVGTTLADMALYADSADKRQLAASKAFAVYSSVVHFIDRTRFSDQEGPRIHHDLQQLNRKLQRLKGQH